MFRAAGILFVDPVTQRVFLVKRSDKVTSPGTWSVPGGHLEVGETHLRAAHREVAEELSFDPNAVIVSKFTVSMPTGSFVLHVSQVGRREAKRLAEDVRLNWENEDSGWFRLTAPPVPLHPGMTVAWPHVVSLVHRMTDEDA
jgi:8-oxo-dGTP pyrophosphatase MutT (NUDIX family)